MRYIEETCIKLISSQPFYANLLTQLEAIEDSRIPVAGCSIQKGKIFLHINSFVFNQLSLENREKILIHELLHVIAKHPSRQKNRNDSIWGIACDAAINQMISGIPITEKVYFPGFQINDKTGIKEIVLEKRKLGGISYNNIKLADGSIISLPKDGSAEEYYNYLVKYANQLSPLDTCIHPSWNHQEDSQIIADAIINEAILNAANACQGNIPNALKIYIDKLLKSTIPWRKILRIFVTKASCQNRFLTYKKQNKRLISEGLPGFKKTKKLNLVVAVDTSSSVDENTLKIFTAEIIKIQKCGANVTIIECDCQIKKAYKLKKKFHPQFEGRGGTDFRPVWNYIEKHSLRPDALIYLTDGQGQAPIKSKYPTLWVLTPSGELPWILTSNGKEQVSWGKSIKLSKK